MSAHREMLVNVSRVARSGQGWSFRANLSFSFKKKPELEEFPIRQKIRVMNLTRKFVYRILGYNLGVLAIQSGSV